MTGTFGPADFAAAMSSLGPFESAPHLAVACSGGADSLALTLLADGWARGVRGRVTALIVDHAMRPESGVEAETVRARLKAQGVDAVVLRREGPPLTADRQASARRARYDLMTGWCRDARVIHLLLGHHRGDQAETLMMRLGRGSGVDGLAAIARVSETADLRLVRPLLGVPRGHLEACLRDRGVEWIEDPSNEDTAFSRVRMRALLPELAREGLTEPRLAATARRMGRAREALEAAATQLLAQAVAIYPEGYALLSTPDMLAAPTDTALRALSRLLTCIGGNPHGPRLERLERLYGWIEGGAGAGRTLAGCRIARQADGRLLLSREAEVMGGPVPARRNVLWDGRFRLLTDWPDDVRLTGLGQEGWRRIRGTGAEPAAKGLPATVRNALPAIKRLEQVEEVPHFPYRNLPDGRAVGDPMLLAFLPPRPLAPARFSAGPGYA
jgi:tRNA(Ile)-lysidine synthase